MKPKSLKLAGAAVFGALSVSLVPITGSIPKMPWGMAILDPQSIIWLTCTFIFGLWSGLLSAIIGSLGIYFLSPEPAPMIGAPMKFIATLPMMLIPQFVEKILKSDNPKNKAGIKAYILASIIAILIRIIVCLPLNLYWAIPLYSIVTGWPLEGIIDYLGGWLSPIGLSGWDALILSIIVMNVWQGLWDAVIPWYITYPTGLKRKFR